MKSWFSENDKVTGKRFVVNDDQDAEGKNEQKRNSIFFGWFGSYSDGI